MSASEPETKSQSAASRNGEAGSNSTVLVDLALQGGGSHGAFTWGVLDRLLEEDWLKVTGISGTSAGAMNAAVFADGYTADGAQGAKAALANYWEAVAEAARFSPFQRSPVDKIMGRWSLDHSPLFIAIDMMSRLFSPYDLNPGNINPLAPILEKYIDFDRLRNSEVKIFITATNVRTGRGRVFDNSEITPEILLASACLPTLFQAVEIDGESYWDGGYTGNPTLTPLVRSLESSDTILVPINPTERLGTPKTAAEILNRLNEVSFNATTLKELRMMALLRQVADPGNSEGALWAKKRIHLVRNDIMQTLDYSSKLNAEREFLHMLRDEGRAAGDDFLKTDGSNIGSRSSVDLNMFLEGV